MATEALLREFNSLPANLQAQVLDFISFLKNSKGLSKTLDAGEAPKRKTPKAGFGKYKIAMSADFDEPLEEFKEYM
jgi:hypothetical protein